VLGVSGRREEMSEVMSMHMACEDLVYDVYKSRCGFRTAGDGRGGVRPRTSSLEICRRTSIHASCRVMKRSYVVELIPVSSSLLIDKSFSITFISKIASLILQIVLDLLLNIQIVEVLHNFKQAICILEQSFTVDRMAARCAQVEIEEPKVAASFPASVLFFGVIVEQLLE
jgi:hypothetical protein